jgi:hypothetical protein
MFITMKQSFKDLSAPAMASAGSIKKFAKGVKNSFIQSKKFKQSMREIFDQCDRNKNGHINKDECYEMVLLLYLKVATVTTVNSKLIPSREFVHDLFDKLDVDNSNTLDFEEFESVAIILFQNAAMGVTTQVICKNVIGPIAAVCIITFVGTISKNPILQLLIKYDLSKMACCMLLNVLLLPYLIKLVDVVMHHHVNNKAMKLSQTYSENQMKANRKHSNGDSSSLADTACVPPLENKKDL